MAYDGITIAGIISELNVKAKNGRIDKIYQPEKDEIILSIRSAGNSLKLLITANPAAPRLHFIEYSKQNPATAPLFCMVLRKHIGGGKIVDIVQQEFERIINIYIEAKNDMGDSVVHRLIVEIMGKHSNIILADNNDVILDSIKHITHDKSSIREVLPNLSYVLPPSQDKLNPLITDFDEFTGAVKNNGNMKLYEVIYKSYTGISPTSADEICRLAGLDSSNVCGLLDENSSRALYNAFEAVMERIRKKNFQPCMYYSDTAIEDFAPFEMKKYSTMKIECFSSFSELFDVYYHKKDLLYRMNQKTQDLRKLVSQHIERCVKKQDIQLKTMRDIENREKYRLYGELITANIYNISKGMTGVEVQNFYESDCPALFIPLDATLSPAENAQKYFKRYNKEKRTFAAMQEQIKQNKEELEYLRSVLSFIENCTTEQDVSQIKDELAEQGFLKKARLSKKNGRAIKKAKPLHYISSDGFDIYVGKNNRQNDELTLSQAKPYDMWLHTKNIPGSHVIISANGREIPDATLNEGALLAAYYSKARESTLVPVDYTPKRYVKKPNGAKPGMVIYETNKTAYITPKETDIKKIQKLDD